MSGLRRAAVALYSVSAADRAVVMAQLPQVERDQLIALLGELHSLGFSRDAAAAAAAGHDKGEEAEDRLELAGHTELFAVLVNEPDVLTARLLGARAWPWRNALLDQYSPARRAAILALRPTPAPAMHRELLIRLASRVPHRAASPVGWRGAAQRLSKWWRM